MDNITHTLAGMAVAETVVQARLRAGPVSASWRTVAWTVALIASNVPDLDILYASIGGKLGYLEHHRGHTHTLALALPLAVLTLVYAYSWWRWRLALWDRRDATSLSLIALFCVVLHMSMDALNNYGVHPFWPMNNRWFYGDTLFIIEPWLWLALIPMVRTSLLRGVWRGLWGTVFTIGLILPYVMGFQPLTLCLVAGALALVWWRCAPNMTGTRRCATGVAALCAILATFGLTSLAVKNTVRKAAAQDLPAWTSWQLVATPMPSNPLCWSIIDVRTDAARTTLLVRTATVTLAPIFQPAATCASVMMGQPHAPMVSITGTDPSTELLASLLWHAMFQAPLAELRALNQRCDGRAFLRFARVPIWSVLADRIDIGDLRYDRDPEQGFAEISLRRDETDCPPWPAPWEPPLKPVL